MKTARYGEWTSPLSAEALSASSLRLQGVTVSGGAVTWVEGRPTEAGRQAIVTWRDGETHDLLRSPWSARTRINEYGGRPYASGAERLWFCNDADQRVYELAPDAEPRALTPDDGARYGDLVPDLARQRLLAVREVLPEEGHESTHAIVAIPLAGGEPRVLHVGEDFYGSLALSPDGAALAFLSWSHPNMPWDANVLWRAGFDADGQLANVRASSQRASLSHFQPRFSPAGELFVVADPDGWWNLARVGDSGLDVVRAEAVEYGLPQWVGGMSTYAFTGDGRIVCARCAGGVWRLGELDPASGELEDLDSAHAQFGALDADGDTIAFLGGGPRMSACVVRRDANGGGERTLRESAPALLDEADVAVAEPVEWTVPGGATSRGFLYLPRNARVGAPQSERPPLIVISHGGPTGQSGSGFALSTQFWTTRGFALLDVNYRGSTGYGREYREALYGEWGVADVADCASGAAEMAARGLVDGERLIIRGGSAGGFTTLAALAFADSFKAGASYYGVSDLELLARDTHKFESRYLEQLIGPYPRAIDTYRSRSPVHHADRIDVPVLFLQGLEDKVVPPNQAETMVGALKARGVKVEYVPFEGEQHGFRRAENVTRAHEAELSFYGAVFGFTPVLEPG